jgi:hypothetical protein
VRIVENPPRVEEVANALRLESHDQAKPTTVNGIPIRTLE